MSRATLESQLSFLCMRLGHPMCSRSFEKQAWDTWASKRSAWVPSLLTARPQHLLSVPEPRAGGWKDNCGLLGSLWVCPAVGCLGLKGGFVHLTLTREGRPLGPWCLQCRRRGWEEHHYAPLQQEEFRFLSVSYLLSI